MKTYEPIGQRYASAAVMYMFLYDVASLMPC